MFTNSVGKYGNDEITQQFNQSKQYSNLIKQNPNFKSTYNEYNKNDPLAQSETIAPDYIPPELTIKNHNTIINSIDRNWYNYPNETPYSFLVKLGGSAKDSSLVVSQNYKNIISFSIERLILPNRVIYNNYTSNITTRLNDYPYLTIVIDGLNYSSYGTNKNLNETIGIYTPLTPLPILLSNITYLEFKNANSQKKEYFPIPESTLSKLQFHINNPTGQTPSNLNDILTVYSIFTNNSNTSTLSSIDYLIVQTQEYFTNLEFRANDLIQFQNYKYHNPSYDESGIFNQYINRASGHNIIDISKSNVSTTLYNQIKIPIPAEDLKTTGMFTPQQWYIDFIDKSFSNVAIADISGKLINSNLQSHLVINIKTLEKNNNNLFLKDLI